jgi:hypothetical protein
VSGAGRSGAAALERSVPRQALHAAWLSLPHPASGDRVEVRSEWPADLRPALAAASGDPRLVDRSEVLDYLGFFESRS